MSNVIGIVNYGIAGNIHSIDKALKKAGANTLIINKAEDFTKVDKLVLPGVGSFKDAMKELKNDGFIEPLNKNTKPILGICLGMQILSTIGFEYGQTKGLNFIDAEEEIHLKNFAVNCWPAAQLRKIVKISFVI